jgi:hypothetical protein
MEISMSQSRSKPAAQRDPDDPPAPREEPTHDVPVYPEQDPTPTPTRESAGVESDVDEDDLDPQSPHSPPDGGVIFDEERGGAPKVDPASKKDDKHGRFPAG